MSLLRGSAAVVSGSIEPWQSAGQEHGVRVKVTAIELMNMDDIAPSAPTAACKQTQACESEAGDAFPQNDSCAISKETQLSQLYVGQQMYVWKARFVSEMFS